MKLVAKLRKRKPKDFLSNHKVIYSRYSDQNDLHIEYIMAVDYKAVLRMIYLLSKIGTIPKDFQVECIIKNPLSLFKKKAVYPISIY